MGSFRANLYVRRLDDHDDKDKRIKFTHEVNKGNEETPYLPELFEKNLMRFTYQHEKRGIAPMIKFLVYVNVGAWSSILVWQFVLGLQNLSGSDGAIEAVNLAFLVPLLGVAVWMFFIYLISQWREP